MKRLSETTFRGLAVLGVLAGSAMHAPAQSSPDPYANESREQRNERMAWWRDARFGMFVHWGVYAVPAGTYKGEPISGIGEWIMLRGKIPVNEYKAYAGQFNPDLYDPEAWARLAKKAGMRYIVITSKHHDGFALFPSAVTDWDVVDATPYGKDLIGPLAEAARAEGLRFGLYYSQAQDWTHPGGAKSGHEEGEGWDELHKGDFDEYLGQIAIPQVGEILSRYRPDILWWDTPRWMTEERAERLIPLVRIVPGIILNNRLGGGYRGDTETPEQHIPATGFKDRDWEVCMTMNGTWGYKSYDHNWKSTKDLIHKLCDIVSKGGNFLLNVGPIAEGLIPQPSVERLEEIGAWMDVNGESIYGTTASPFHRLTWGRCTKKEHPGGTTLYLHVFDWPDDGRLVVPGLKSVPVSTRLLQDGKAFAAEPVVGAEPGLAIMVPNAAPDPIASVIRLEVEGELDVEPIMPRQSADGAVELEPAFADLHNRLGSQLQLESKSRKINIGHWTDARAWVGWTFQISQPATFNVQVEMASEKDSNLTFGLRNQPKTRVALGATEGYGDFQARELGTLEIPATGTYTLELQPVKQEWSPINLRSVSLRPRK